MSDRTSLMSEKIQPKQFLLSSKLSSSSQIRSYHTNTTTKLNEYRNNLTLPSFNVFCQPLHVASFYNIFDQCLLCSYENLFQPVHKKLLKSRNDSLLIYRLLHYFSVFSKISIWWNAISFPPWHSIVCQPYRSISFVG